MVVTQIISRSLLEPQKTFLGIISFFSLKIYALEQNSTTCMQWKQIESKSVSVNSFQEQ